MRADETEKDWKRRCFNERRPACWVRTVQHHRAGVGTLDTQLGSESGEWGLLGVGHGRVVGVLGVLLQGGCLSEWNNGRWAS